MYGKTIVVKFVFCKIFSRFRMVVIETKSEITEYTGHEVISTQYGGGKSHFNNRQNYFLF